MKPESKAPKDKKSSKKSGGKNPIAAGARATSERLPSFSVAYPSHPELLELLRAFQNGNYAKVREEAPQLAERSEDPEVQWAARDLRARLEPDPLAVRLLLISGILLLFLAIWFYMNGYHH
jgi:hypothetical protein